MATDIDSLLQLGRRKGLAAGLSHRLICLWQDTIASAQPSSALQCLRNALAVLKSQGWLNVVIDDNEWHPQILQTEYANTSALLVKSRTYSAIFLKRVCCWETSYFRLSVIIPLSRMYYGNMDCIANWWSHRVRRYSLP
ncbi:hypothetical protein ACRZ29_000257 [Edwardsiella piscicida]